MSPKPFKPFKRSKKSPFDHDGPSHKALKEALDWLATHDTDAPLSRLIREVRKTTEHPSEELPIPSPHESVKPATDSVDAATEPEPSEQEEASGHEQLDEGMEEVAGAPPSVCEGGSSGEYQEQTEEVAGAPASPPNHEDEGGSSDEYDEEAEQIAAQIHSFSRSPQRPLINSRRIRRTDDDDPANLSRHRRLCVICHHEDKYAIEQAFLEWRRPNDIKSEFRLPERSCIYRHARATGLFEKRARNLRSGLEKVIEESTYRPPSADSIIRAVRVYSCLDANGRWVEPPRNLIITHNTVQRREALSARQSDETLPATEPKKLINVDPTILELEKGA